MGYRYVDWSITVPLQMIEFNLILKAAGKKPSSFSFWKLLIGTVVMLLFGYLGEIKVLPPMIGFIGGMCGWVCILQEIFLGESGGTAKDCSPAISTRLLQHALDRHSRLVHLPSWLLLWLSA